ncbi:MAG: hypothetical protein K1X83_08110 [Oligoflexia bacterium]|nr:hypothetical protein [Oligoflexia bacterium]
MALEQSASHPHKRRADLGEGAGQWPLDKAAADLHHRLTHIQPGSSDELREGTLECRVSSHSTVTWREIFDEYARQGIFEVAWDGRTITRLQQAYEQIPSPAEVCAAFKLKSQAQKFDLSTEEGLLGLIALKVTDELEQQLPELGRGAICDKALKLAQYITAELNAKIAAEGARFHLSRHLCESIVRSGYEAVIGTVEHNSEIHDLARCFMEPLYLSKVHDTGPDSFRNYTPRQAA